MTKSLGKHPSSAAVFKFWNQHLRRPLEMKESTTTFLPPRPGRGSLLWFLLLWRATPPFFLRSPPSAARKRHHSAARGLFLRLASKRPVIVHSSACPSLTSDASWVKTGPPCASTTLPCDERSVSLKFEHRLLGHLNSRGPFYRSSAAVFSEFHQKTSRHRVAVRDHCQVVNGGRIPPESPDAPCVPFFPFALLLTLHVGECPPVGCTYLSPSTVLKGNPVIVRSEI